MTRVSRVAEGSAIDLVDKRQFLLKTTLIGGFVGSATAIAAGGPLVQQLLQGVLITAIVSGGLYGGLLAVADYVTDSSGEYRMRVPAADSEPRPDRQVSTDESPSMNAR